MNLYLVAVILQPTKKQKDEDGVMPTIVVQPTAVLAKDETSATVKAARLVPEEFAKFDDRLEVTVAPFRAVAR